MDSGNTLRWSRGTPVGGLGFSGLLAADAGTVLEVRKLCHAADNGCVSADTWALIRARISEFLATVEGEAELRLCEQLDGETKDSRPIEARAIVGELGREIDEVSESARFAAWVAEFSSGVRR